MSKKLILHDLLPNEFEAIAPALTAEYTIFPANPIIQPCVGCFGCWIKTPGECVINDRGKGFTALMSKHDELVVISRLVFGGFSPSIKAVIDRSIGFVLPFFHLVKKEMHHPRRYCGELALRCVFYGHDITVREKEIAQKLVIANTLNMGTEKHTVEFYSSFDAIEVAR